MENLIVYAQVGGSFQQIGGGCPEGWVEMQGERPGEGGADYIATAEGAWVRTPPDENLWRIGELAVIARQLEAIEEDEADETPPDLLPGTKKQWLKYRGQVSNWKEGIAPFPDAAQHPAQPE